MRDRRLRTALLAIVLGACDVGTPSDVSTDGGGSNGGDGGGSLVDAPPGSIDPGSLDVRWMHGSANCDANADPELQAHDYNATTIIFRQNKCDTFEAPFMYLLLGTTKALLLDTGAINTDTLRQAVMSRIGSRMLVVAHSHAHGDHISGDSRFGGQPNTMLVAPNRAAVQTAFGIEPWPADPGSIDLGDRALEIVGLPGHEQSHIVIYDRRTGLLLTGDSLYPGLLFINDWAMYRESMSRLASFVSSRAVTHVLGAHVEMTSTPQQAYAYGETYQPNEHVLQLSASHVTELDAALMQLGPTPPSQAVRYDDFVIVPP